MTRSILLAIHNVIDEFLTDRCDIDKLQGRLGANASSLDRTFGDLIEELQGLDGDLEEIQFTMLRDEQRPAAILRLERTQELLAAALCRCEPGAE